MAPRMTLECPHEGFSVELVHRTVRRFRGRVVLEARGLVCQPTLGLKLLKKKKKKHFDQMRISTRFHAKRGPLEKKGDVPGNESGPLRAVHLSHHKWPGD